MSALDEETQAELALIERKKMMAGEAYNAMFDAGLIKGRLDARELLYAYNNYPPLKYEKGMDPSAQFGPDERFEIIRKLFGLNTLEEAKRIAVEPPFRCDYGVNIKFDGDFYCNFDCVILDCAEVRFGHRVLLAPGVHIYAATHSVEVSERIAGLERAYPVKVGNDVWIGGGAMLIGPCVIGDNCTVAAGTVVRGTWPSDVVIGGNPARILKKLEPPPTANEAPTTTA